jgi:hypothetical protein
MDFTINTYSNLLKNLLRAGFSFQTFEQFLIYALPKTIVLRHDVDLLPRNSLRNAQIEHELGIRGSYYFRIVPESNHPEIIRKIAALGHEIGYHYEDLTFCKGNENDAYVNFKKNLDYFWQFYPVKTICMHGSPMSRYDSRDLWKYYDYKQLGIIGEPYFDIDFSKVLYITDTGRRWDGDKVSVRDKAYNNISDVTIKQFQNRFRFHSTNEIIKAALEGELPNQIMITTHPQRWFNNPILWTKELIQQNLKNFVKRGIILLKS